jgi:hypothetical protein
MKTPLRSVFSVYTNSETALVSFCRIIGFLKGEIGIFPVLQLMYREARPLSGFFI